MFPDWRIAMNSLSRRVVALWQKLSVREKERFLRHLRSHWDCHRHRIPPEVHSALERCSAATVRVIAGKIAGIEKDGEGLR